MAAAAKKTAPSGPFQNTPRELAALNRAHATYMDHVRAGHRYDVIKRAWVEADENVVAQGGTGNRLNTGSVPA